MSRSKLNPETLALHAGWRADPATGAVAPRIYQTAAYQFRDTERAANIFTFQERGGLYTRLGCLRAPQRHSRAHCLGWVPPSTAAPMPLAGSATRLFRLRGGASCSLRHPA